MKTYFTVLNCNITCWYRRNHSWNQLLIWLPCFSALLWFGSAMYEATVHYSSTAAYLPLGFNASFDALSQDRLAERLAASFFWHMVLSASIFFAMMSLNTLSSLQWCLWIQEHIKGPFKELVSTALATIVTQATIVSGVWFRWWASSGSSFEREF